MKFRTKILVAFLAVVLLMGLTQSFYLQARMEHAFGDYIEKTNRGYVNHVKRFLEEYYRENRSFAGLEESLSGAGPVRGGKGPANSRGHHRMSGTGMDMLSRYDVIVFDKNGTIIADSSGEKVGQSAEGLAGQQETLIVDGEEVGTVLFHRYKLQEFEEEYLRASRMAILVSSLLAGLSALLLSVLLTRSISRPLNQLMLGIQQLGRNDKVKPVQISSSDEFQKLGEAFNEMSDRLARNEEARRTLVADVAHELRTPLTILQGKLEAIQAGAEKPTEQAVLELTDEVYRLNRLVKDLQQLSLAEAGQLPLQKQSVQMKPFIEKICSQLQFLADEKGISLNYESIPEETVLLIDMDRMTQVLVNLVGNALRHTPEGGRIEIFAEEVEEGFRLHVADTGPGIPEENLPYIFERFYKRDSARTRKSGGTGLGLSIAKGFVEAHGGTIKVASQVGQGTIFTITLPLQNNK